MSLETFQQWISESDPLALALGAIVVGVLILLAALLWRRRRGPPPLREPALAIDLDSLTAGPPEEGPQLHCYGLPVRLAVMVLAPAGRGGEVPAGVERSAALDQIVPGLPRVAAAHGTLIKVWPAQLSPRGFAQVFFTNVKLPGDRGKGSPWCSLAGRFEANGQPYLAGMALCAARPNSLSQHTIELPSEWLEVLRTERAL
jgi:hypothetical protein